MKKTPLAPSPASDSPVMRYVLIVALIVLLGFAILYIVNIQKASKETFDNSSAGSGSFQVVYIYSNSCGYCTKFTPTFNSYATTAPANVTVNSYERSMPAAAQYMTYVSAFPTVLVLDKNGKLINSQTGNVSLSDLQSFVSSSIQ